MPRATILLLGLVLLLACACGPPSSQQGTSDSGSSDRPELTDDVIRERINEAWVREIPEESGSGDPIYLNFDPDEPKEIAVVEKQVDGTKATIVLDIKTGSSPRSRNKFALAGEIRTHWELQTGWVLRRWEIVETENISMKYKDLRKTEEKPKPADPESLDREIPPQAPKARP